MKSIFQLKNVVKKYHSGEGFIFALDDVTISIPEAKITTILGPSGSGKTTLLNSISGLDNIDSGEIIFRDTEHIEKMSSKQLTEYRRHNVGFIFQNYNLINNLTVRENIEIGHDLSADPLNIDEVIKLVGLDGHANKMTYQLSGGQQQRVAIARVLVKNPAVIFCDEPTGALDEKTGKSILSLLQKLNSDQGRTIVMVTHNPAISDISHLVLKFNSGKIAHEQVNKDVKDAFDIEWA